MEGAENLLVKAVSRWRDDQPRALRYLHVASKLPFDDNERVLPAAAMADFMLFSMITDELEDCAEGDESWLDAALRVLARAEAGARFHIRDALVSIDQEYDLSTRENRRLRAAVESIPPRPELGQRSDLDPRQLHVELALVMESCVAYQEELGRMLDEGTD